MSLNSPRKIYFADGDRRASSRGMRVRTTEGGLNRRDAFLPHTEMCDGISSTTPLPILIKLSLIKKKGDNDNRVQQKRANFCFTPKALKGSGGDLKFKRFHSLKTFDDQALLAVIGESKGEKQS